MMRITGGQSRGRLLASLKGSRIRPTSDKVRESIFNLLGQDMMGLKVLDLFAGTGSLGIEALSRGALWALFIDHSKQAIQLILKNLRVCGYQASGHVLKRDLTRDLPWEHPLMKEQIDLIFIDPPYGKDLVLPVLSKLSQKGILKPSCVAVTESSKTDLLPSMIGKFQLYDTRLYGETKIEIFHCEESK